MLKIYQKRNDECQIEDENIVSHSKKHFNKHKANEMNLVNL